MTAAARSRRVAALRPLAPLGLALASLITSCGAEPTCDAGSTQLCLCAGGLQGAQACADDGTAWGACDCVAGAGEGGDAGEERGGDGAPTGSGEGEGEGEGEEGEGEPGGGEGEGEGPGPGPAADPESCNGQDDDGDGRVDEVDEVVESLRVTFDPRTSVEPGRGTIEVTGRDDVPVQGSPFSGGDLAGRTLDIPGNLVRIRLTADAQATPLFGYALTSVVDQNGREALGPLPESAHDHPAPVDDERTFEMADSLGMGLTCGADIGACTLGRTTCLGGRQVCTGDQRPTDELCNGLDDDCDGDVDEPEDLTDTPPCDKTLGVCAAARPVCQGAEGYAPCNSQQYGPEYEVTELSCDCLDNDCDGVVDGAVGAVGGDDVLLGCTIDDLAATGEGRHCVVQVSSETDTDEFRFGTLVIPEGVVVGAPTGVDGRMCGFNGAYGGCDGTPPRPLGGGCITIHADELHVDGILHANAEPGTSCGGTYDKVWSGGSGGDVVIRAESVRVRGAIQAHGARARRGPQGGGAAGSIRIWSPRMEVVGAVEARAGVGQGHHDLGPGLPGEGSGGPGGSANGPGGAGAGGPPLGREGGIAAPDRALVLIGGLELADGSVVGTWAGEGQPTGYVVLGGATSSLSAQIHGGQDVDRGSPPVRGTSTLMSVALRLTLTGGVRAAAVFQLVEADSGAVVGQGQTDELGWAAVNIDFASDLRHRLEVTDMPALAGGSLFFSHGNADLGLGCTLDTILNGDPPSAVIPALQDCQ